MQTASLKVSSFSAVGYIRLSAYIFQVVHANEEQHIILKTCGHHHRSCYTAAS